MSLSKVMGFALGPIGVALLGFVSVPLLAWLFDQEDIGRLNILQMACSFGMIAFSLGLDQAYIREYHTSNNKALLFMQCFMPVLLLLLLCSLIVLSYAQELAEFLFKMNNGNLAIILLVAIWATLLLRFSSTILRMQGKGWLFSLTQLLNRILLIVFCVALYFSLGPTNFMSLSAAFAMGVVAAALLALFSVRRTLYLAVCSLRTIFFLEGVKPLITFGWPLIFAGLCYWGLTATGTFVLSEYSTLNELGIYSVALSFGAAASVFQQIFTVMWAPTLYKWVAEGVGAEHFTRITQEVMSLVALIFCGVGMFAWLVDWLLPAEYAIVKYLVLCTIAPPLLYTLSEVTAAGIGVSRKTWLNGVAAGSAFLLNVVLAISWVPRYGAVGAVIANTLAYLLYFIVRTEAANKVWHQQPRLKMYIIIAGLVASSLLNAWASLSSVSGVFVIWVLVSIIICVIYRKNYVGFGRILIRFIQAKL